MTEWQQAVKANRAEKKEPYVWRLNDLLVVRQGAELPKRCLRTNSPATVFVYNRNMSSLPQWSWLLLLVLIVLGGGCGIVLAIYLFYKRQNLDFALPFCDEVIHKHRRQLLFFMTAMALACAGIPLFTLLSERGGLLIGMLLIGFVALLGKALEKPLVEVDHFEGNLVFIKNVHPKFLAELPNF